MRRKLVIGNWKMHGSLEANHALISGLAKALERLSEADKTQVVICPVSVHLAAAAQQLNGLPGQIGLGAQNVSHAASGAYTGEVAASMLAEAGVTLVLVGHSERRELFGEGDALVADKVAAVLDADMTPVLCVGESLAQRQAGETESVVLRQLNAAVQRVGVEGIARSIVAYEPIWAIGTGETATPEQAQEVHEALRKRLAELDEELAANTPILYGGSVKASNADALFAQPDIDGGLVGGASLDAEEFSAICASSARSGASA